MTSAIPPSPRSTFALPQPQTIVVVREELDYYVMPEGPMLEFRGSVPMGKGLNQKVPSDIVFAQGSSAMEMVQRVPDSSEFVGDYLDDDGNLLDVNDNRDRIPQRRLFMLALLRRGCGKWLLDRRRVLDASEPTPGSPMLHHLGSVSDVDQNMEWGYREMEVGKCRMVSLAMLRNVDSGAPQTPVDRPTPVVSPTRTTAKPVSVPTSPTSSQPVPNLITQVDEPVMPQTPTTLRRPMRKCWWERRFVRCKIPAGMVDAVERRAQRWREELERQDKVHAAEAELMAAIARSNPARSQSSEFPVFDPEDREQMELMVKYQDAQAELLSFRRSPGPGTEAGGPGDPTSFDDAFGLDIDVQEDNAWVPVSRISGDQAAGEQLPGPYNVILNQDVPLRDAAVNTSSKDMLWYEKSEHIVRLWTRRVYTVEYIVL